jgi:PIN domain nuclease of toxin-antitoxin system
MRFLLDTHAFLWWNEASPKLSLRAARLLSDPRNHLLFSVVSAWEIIVKAQLGKLKLPSAPAAYIVSRLEHYGIETLSLRLGHVLAAEQLPVHHRDPFDRMLIAQARVEQLPIITHDPEIGKYSVETVW